RMHLGNILAKALYDNKAESPDELAFRKGDILTVLEQNVLESVGWWKCSLHGRQGLAPANRLHLLADSQAANPGPGHRQWPDLAPAGRKEKKQGSPRAQLTGLWVRRGLPRQSSSPGAQLPSSVELRGLPQLGPSPGEPSHRAPGVVEAAAAGPEPQGAQPPRLGPSPGEPSCHISGVAGTVAAGPEPRGPQPLGFGEWRGLPGCARVPLSSVGVLCFPPRHSPYPAGGLELQMWPASPVYDVPPTTAKDHDISLQNKPQRICLGHYNTLPNPQKSEWIYDIPVSPEKEPSNHSLEKKVLYDIPPARYGSTLQNITPTNIRDKLANPQMYDVPPLQRKLTVADIPCYDVPPSRDMPVWQQNNNYNVPPSVLTPRVEQQNSEHNVYDTPKRLPTTLQHRRGTEKNNGSFGNDTYNIPPQLSKDTRLEQDRFSISRMDCRTSTLPTPSSTSAETFSMSSSEEPTKEIKLELDLAIETLTKLQHSVSSSVASLMIFVSSKWRLQEHLETNIEEIHRAIDHIKVSLGEFLDFARAIKVNASCITDNNLQTRIKTQLKILTDSFQILLETREALNKSNWSLAVLVLKKPQNNPDDLDRFVMVARTIPDDIKRFVSIIIANGKLLFRKNCEEQETKPSKTATDYKMAKQIPIPRRIEVDSLQRNALDKLNKSKISSEKSRENVIEDCDYVQLQVSVVPTAKKHNIQNSLELAKKITLSENSRLYFGALHKATSVFTSSLSNNQPPEVFIAQSKLIIMVGQRLVDSLCQETQEKDIRNDILCNSCQFCSMLKNLAVATKNAAMQYPNVDAVQELQNQTDELSKFIQQFRGMME
uniref:Cas scaffold protein family member 4 n=1 Tax=Pelusios castaneus TaxID=367368 RepID=A0A8C8VLU5_9SAUR